MAVNWYFDIRESEYGWIKPENTVNVDEGGIMAGFGEYLPLLIQDLPINCKSRFGFLGNWQ